MKDYKALFFYRDLVKEFVPYWIEYYEKDGKLLIKPNK